MTRDAAHGSLLFVGSLLLLVVVAHHPNARAMLASDAFPQVARRNIALHAVAIVAVVLLFVGLLGISRRIGRGHLNTLAEVTWGLGSVAAVFAAVMSGFVATDVISRLLESQGAARDLYHALLTYTGVLNRGFADVHEVAWSSAIVLWSVALLRSRRMSRLAGAYGIVAGGLAIGALLSSHLRLDVHGLAVVSLLQMVWLVWIGIILWRMPKGE